MLKGIIEKLIISLLFLATAAFAGSGNLFRLTSSGVPLSKAISITLCLNINGPVSCQDYTVDHELLSIMTTVPNHTYVNAGIRINTAGFTYTPAQPRGNVGTYTYIDTVSDTQAAAGTLASTIPNLFSVTANLPAITLFNNQSKNTTFTVTNLSGADISSGLTYIANGTPSTSFQNTVSGGSACGSSLNNGASCTLVVLAESTNTAGSGFVSPQVCYQGNCYFGSTNGQTAVTVTARASFTYVPNFFNNTVSMCTMNSDDTFDSCSSFSDPSFDLPNLGVMNAAGTILYVSNLGSAGGTSVSICPINSNGSLGTCASSSGNGTFSNPGSPVLNSQGTILYVPNSAASNISICPLNSDGSLGNCVVSADPTFNAPSQIAINPQGTFLYATDIISNLVSICPINADGTIASCTGTTDPTFNDPNAAAMNAAGTLLYVSNAGTNNISVCHIQSNGLLGTCDSLSDPSFIQSLGISFNPSGSLMYVGNQDTTLSICPLDANGTLSGSCTVSTGSGTFFGPENVIPS